MDETLATLFTADSAKRLEQLTTRIHACLDKLTADQVWARGGEHENAVGNLVLHLCGNVRQWIVMGVGGVNFDRDRDAEFTARSGMAPRELKQVLRSTVDAALPVITAQTAATLAKRTVVQGYEGSHLEAIYHVLCHFSEHTGQIIFVTKACSGEGLGFYSHLSQKHHSEKTP